MIDYGLFMMIYTNRQNWYTVVCILIVYIILYGIIFHDTIMYVRIDKAQKRRK